MTYHNMRKFFLILLGLLGLPAFSQEATVDTEIVTIALNDAVAGLYFHNGKDIATLQANSTGLGEPMKYKGLQRFVLRTSVAEFSMKPPLPAPHAWVDLPLNSGRVLLACLKTGDAPVKMVAYDIGKARIGEGEYRFFNFSHSVISVIFGEHKFAVKPAEDTLVSDPLWKKEVGEIDLAMAIMKEGKAKPVYSSQWGNRPGRRNYIFMFDGPQEYKPIRICRFFDVPPSEPEKAKP
ncbi:MAG: hypothetical protein CFE26_10855 [Verrucomicrobiales bacterium VVV1]|nr:MAG: hypothetical protein CFE26_10855 [Verrucomicrobiales bacterium VVV1]